MRFTPLLFSIAILISTMPCAQADRYDPQTRLWKRAGFTNPVFSTIEVPVAAELEARRGVPVTHVLDATVVMFRNAGWTKELIEANFKRTNEIYTQCGIRMGEIQFVESDAPQGRLDLNSRWESDSDDVLLAKATPVEKRPVFYFLRKILPNHSGGREGAFTNIVSFWQPLEPVSYSTLWISSVINDPNYSSYHDMTDDGKSVLKFRDPSYNVIAHEIAHLLADMGHEDFKEKNLLNGSSELLNDHLLPSQCEKFKKNPLLRKI